MLKEKLRKRLMDSPIVNFIEEDLGSDGRLFLSGMLEHFPQDYIRVVDVFLDDIKETEVEGEGKYYYYLDIDEYAEEAVLYASFNKNWLIERLIVDYFINLVTDN